MIRIFLVLFLALITTSMVSAFAVAFGESRAPFLPVVLLVAFVAMMQIGAEGMVVASLLGFLLDAWSGSLLGINVLVCLILYLGGSPLNRILGSPRGASAFLVGALFVMGYGLIHGGLFALFGAGTENVDAVAIIVSGFWNGLMAVLFFPFVHYLFVYFGFSEREVTLAERLSSRSTSERRR